MPRESRPSLEQPRYGKIHTREGDLRADGSKPTEHPGRVVCTPHDFSKYRAGQTQPAPGPTAAAGARGRGSSGVRHGRVWLSRIRGGSRTASASPRTWRMPNPTHERCRPRRLRQDSGLRLCRSPRRASATGAPTFDCGLGAHSPVINDNYFFRRIASLILLPNESRCLIGVLLKSWEVRDGQWHQRRGAEGAVAGSSRTIGMRVFARKAGCSMSSWRWRSVIASPRFTMQSCSVVLVVEARLVAAEGPTRQPVVSVHRPGPSEA